MSPTTHKAVVTTAPRAPLSLTTLTTPTPTGTEVLIRNLWTASTPLDLHQADGGLLVSQHPMVMGGGAAGIVTATGPDVQGLKVGDRVFGFSRHVDKAKAHQEYSCVEERLVGKVPEGWEGRLREAVTLPNNFVSAWHALVIDLGIQLPWPKPDKWTPSTNMNILIWGGSSSVGQFALQILRWYGYNNVLATASERNFGLVKDCGATSVADYGAPDVAKVITEKLGKVDLVLDCIGSQEGSVKPISKIVGTGAKVAVLLPVIVTDATEEVEPVYAMDVAQAADWGEGVEVKGVRTHHYLENEFHAKYLQPEIMPTLLAKGVVKPNKQKIVEGATLLERAQKAMDMLRRKEVSGERLVWRVAEDE